MSLSRSKAFFTGVMLAILFVMAGSVMAFTPEGGRLWRPYQPESFGGNRRSADGFFFSVEGIAWKVDGPKSMPVGFRNADGSAGSRMVYDGNSLQRQHSSVNTSSLNSSFALGTRVEFGNVKGHHGWMFTGYGLPGSTATETQRNGSIVINDPENMTSYGIFGSNVGYNSVYDKNGGFYQFPYPNIELPSIPQTPLKDVGYLWGWFPVEWADPWHEGRLAPLPINFDRLEVSNTVDLIDLELMYTYRAHPFKWGEMELYAGARYWDMDDTLDILGRGYELEIYEDDDNNNSSNNDDDDTNPGQVNSNENGVLSVIADTTIMGRVRNRIVGPQFGVKFSRRNARWTFGAEGRFMAGINMTSQTVSGTLGSNFIDTSKVQHYDGIGTITQSGVLPYVPIGLSHATQSFHYHRNKTWFSPGFELRLNAKWQMTDAVGLQVGFNTTIVDNVARGADVIDYRINEDGSLFGLRDPSKTTVIVYGVNFGINIRR